MTTGIRKTIYFSKSKDSELINFVSNISNPYDVSREVKGLMRDGLKYRSKSSTQSHTNVQFESFSTDFSGINLSKKNIRDDDLEDRLDSF